MRVWGSRVSGTRRRRAEARARETDEITVVFRDEQLSKTTATLPRSSGRVGLVVEANKRVTKTTKAVLLKTTDVGKEGEMIEVSNGFFRSYLEPYGVATKVSAELMAQFEAKAAAAAAAKAKELADAKALCTALTTIGKFVVKKTVGEDGKIFGSVSAVDLVESIKTQTGKELDKSAFAVPDISKVGVYEVSAQFHKNAKCSFKLEVQKA